MLRIMKDFSTEYMHSFTVDEVSKAVPRPPMSEDLKKRWRKVRERHEKRDPET